MANPQLDRHATKLIIELDPGARMCGRMMTEGEPRTFDGWMQLTSLLEEIRSRANREPTSSQSADDRQGEE